MSLSRRLLSSVCSFRAPVHALALASLCASMLLAAPTLAEGEAKAKEGDTAEEAKDSKAEKAGKESGAEASASKPAAAKPAAASAPAAAKKPSAKGGDAYAEPDLGGPADWPAGKPPGPGPQGWPDGKTAKDFENPDQEAEGGPDGGSPEDGVGVACRDYIDCVCGMAELAAGKTLAGYNHEGTCTVAKTYSTSEYEVLCAEELDQVKDALEDAKEDYKANGIKLPAACQ